LRAEDEEDDYCFVATYSGYWIWVGGERRRDPCCRQHVLLRRETDIRWRSSRRLGFRDEVAYGRCGLKWWRTLSDERVDLDLASSSCKGQKAALKEGESGVADYGWAAE